VASVEGSIHDLERTKVESFPLGFGNVSNHLVKAYSLWRGLFITKEEGIKTLIVLRDSILVIRVVMDQAIRSIKIIAPYFNKEFFYHIKSELNGKENYWARWPHPLILVPS